MAYIVANSGESISAKFDGALRMTYANDQDYIVDNIGSEFAMTYNSSSLQVSVGTGVANICGRGIMAEESNSLTLTANATTYLCLRIDLTQTQGQEGMLYANTTSTIATDNLNNVNGQHDMLLAVVTTDSNGVVNLVDKRNIKSKSSTLDFNLIYPVGSIYMSVNSTSPQTLFGGTWQQIQNTFLLACGSSYNAGSTGGSATNSHTHSVTPTGSVGNHTLTIAEIPSHTHAVGKGTSGSIAGIGAYYGNGTNSFDTQATGGGQAHDHPLTLNTITSGGASNTNNMPPYLAVYMWKRTA